jgi:hypothetical protein
MFHLFVFIVLSFLCDFEGLRLKDFVVNKHKNLIKLKLERSNHPFQCFIYA